MSYFYKIGRIKININGNNLIVKNINQELNPNLDSMTMHSDVEFSFYDNLEPLSNYSFYSPVLVSNVGYRAKHSGFEYQVSEESGKIIVNLRPNSLSLKRRLKPRFLDWNYLSVDEVLAKNFMYDIYDYLTQISNLKKNQSYIHASSFEKNGRGVAIVAWGGIGKTTSLLKLVLEDHWKFLSDDLGIIDEEGFLYRSPKKLQIYAYNLANQPLIEKQVISERSTLDKISWYLHLKRKGPKGVRRRVSAEELFGDSNISTRAKLTDLFFIERASANVFSSEPISQSELARRAAFTILSEMQPFGKISNAIYSSEFNPIIPSELELYENTYSVLTKAFSSVSPTLIKIPMNAGPNELADYLRKYLYS